MHRICWNKILVPQHPTGRGHPMSQSSSCSRRSCISRRFQRCTVSYTNSDNPVLSVIMDMLNKAFAKLPCGETPILHSAQGWQYQYRLYQEMLKEQGILQSMRRKENCLDNAVMENFFGRIKSELLYIQDFEPMEHFKTELIDCLDYYNNRRIKAMFKGLPPAVHRKQALNIA